MPGCFSAGKTIEEVIENTKKVISDYIEIMDGEGKPVPKASPIEYRSDRWRAKG